jgi:O-antigen ligase
VSYQEWRRWISSLPWKYRWFVILVLIRPIVDFSWNERFFFSFNLLQVIGVLTPVLIIFLIVTRQLSSAIASDSKTSRYFFIWSIFLLFNALITFFGQPSLESINIALKLTFPIYIYLFLRYFIKSKADLEGIFQTILYSTIVPASLVIYEIVVSPIRVATRSEGVTRVMAGYSDVVYLSIFVLLSLLIIGYFWLAQQDGTSRNKIRLTTMLIIIGMDVLCLVRINHAASFITFGVLLGFFILYNLRPESKSALIAVMLISFIVVIGISVRPQKTVGTLVQTDIDVLRGEKNADAALHGRVWAWKRHWNYFNARTTFGERMFGMVGKTAPFLLGVGPHNDFLRIIYATGYLGLIVYLFMLFSIFQQSRKVPRPQKFMIQGMLIIIVMMSITTTPTFYVHVDYIFMSILAFLALPKKLREGSRG